MPAERTAMCQVREIMRLHQAGISTRQIGIRVGVAASTVRLTLRRLAAAGMAGVFPAEQTDAALEKVLFTGAGKKTGHRRHPDPDWPAIHQDLKRKHVTLTIVWDEYIARHPDGYRYSRFCELYRGWEARLSVTMRQSHRAGEKLFVEVPVEHWHPPRPQRHTHRPQRRKPAPQARFSPAITLTA